MLNNTDMIRVTNRDNGTVGYIIPDLGNLRREFQPGETKTLSFEELKKLSYLPGGMVILREYLLIDNKDAVEELFNENIVDVAPEYFYTKADIDDLLLNGSLDALLDCLDFAPNGVIELVKDEAVNLKLNDVAKRTAIFEKTGFNVTTALSINKEAETAEAEAPVQRRVQPNATQSESAAPERRAPAPKIKVLTK